MRDVELCRLLMIVALVGTLTTKALAQTAPPLAFETTLDLVTGERRVTRIVVDRAGEPVAYTAADWLRPRVVGYALGPTGIPVVFGTPGRSELPRGLAEETGADLPQTPEGSARIDVLIDDAINSTLLNIAEGREGLVLAFDPPLKEGAGRS